MERESHKEFAARMDRARESDAAEDNRATVVGLTVYALAIAAYLLFRHERMSVLGVVLVAMVSILLAVMIRSLISIYRSRRM